MTVFLVRHANAGNRSEWTRPDEQRPLSTKGEKQARRLADLLADRGIERVLSSPSLRCVQTVESLAERLGLGIETSEALREGAGQEEVVGLFRSLAQINAALCTHGDVIPTLLDALTTQDGLVLPDGYRCAKGSTWVLEPSESGRAVKGMYLPPP